MFTRNSWMPALMVLSVLSACASTPPQSEHSASRAYVTGSRLAVPVDSRTGTPEANPAQQQVSSDDIALTGQTDTAAALRRLVPQMH